MAANFFDQLNEAKDLIKTAFLALSAEGPDGLEPLTVLEIGLTNLENLLRKNDR